MIILIISRGPGREGSPRDRGFQGRLGTVGGTEPGCTPACDEDVLRETGGICEVCNRDEPTFTTNRELHQPIPHHSLPSSSMPSRHHTPPILLPRPILQALRHHHAPRLVQLLLQVRLLGSFSHMFFLRSSDNVVLRFILACGGLISVRRRLSDRLGQAGCTCGTSCSW